MATATDIRTKLAAAHLCIKEVADYCGEKAADNAISKSVAKLETMAHECYRICNQISSLRTEMMTVID